MMTAVLERIFPQRYWSWIACILLCAACLALSQMSPAWYWPAGFFGLLALVGLLDFIQVKHAIRRNYPVVANLRFLIEFFRPEIRQYLLEGDNEEQPFSRAQRSIVYQRAKNVIDKRPFGTMIDLYEPHYEWINHSIAPADIVGHDFRIAIGGKECANPTRRACSTFPR
jgi:glutamate synthase domain-containing protein 2